MTIFLLWVLIFQCLAIISWGFMQRGRMIQFPFLAAAVFLGWMLPQLVGLVNRPLLPQEGLEKTIFMAILCLAAAWWGYTRNNNPAKLFWWRFHFSRLVWGSAILSLLGAFFFYQVSLLASDVQVEIGSQWTGIITIYTFFAKMLTFGMAIALILHFYKPNWYTLLILLLDLMLYLDSIIIKGRRAAMIELGLMLLMALWFRLRWMPSRRMMVAVLIVGALVINSIGDYRNTMMGKDRWSWSGAGISEILEIDYADNFRNLFSGDAPNYELTNAVINIEAIDRQMEFDFWFSHWNWLVHRYVPGQWLGKDTKQALMFDFAGFGSVSKSASDVFGYTHSVGTTPTGLSDAFQSFWYFGAINFFFIGWIMSRWYMAAIRGNIVAQVIIMLLMTPSLHAITHSTHWFSIYFVQLAAFLLPVFLIARIAPRKH